MFDPLFGCLIVLFSVLFKGPTLPGTVLLVKPAHPFLDTFSFTFSDLFFYHSWVPKGAKLESAQITKSSKSGKTLHLNASPIEPCKKTPSGRGQTSEFDDGYTLSSVFSKAQGSEKGIEMEPT